MDLRDDVGNSPATVDPAKLSARGRSTSLDTKDR